MRSKTTPPFVRATTIVVSLLLLNIALAAPPAATTSHDIVHDAWAGYFPPATSGLRARSVQLDAASGEPSPHDSGSYSRIRQRIWRDYDGAAGRVRVMIDTRDIETAASVDAVTAATSDRELTAALRDEGITSVPHLVYSGIAIEPERGLTARIYKLGTAVVVSLVCNWTGCGAELERMADRMDFESIARIADESSAAIGTANLEGNP